MIRSSVEDSWVDRKAALMVVPSGVSSLASRNSLQGVNRDLQILLLLMSERCN
jgi:hypothetical protein